LGGLLHGHWHPGGLELNERLSDAFREVIRIFKFVARDLVQIEEALDGQSRVA
jgi:hypothetical protein